MTIEEQIRKLARSNYWQELYSSSQKCSGIRLFKNEDNFSGLQVLFLYWLRVYSMLYEELYSFEWDNLDEQVINNNGRCDSFLYWRRKHQEQKLREYKREERKHSKKSKGKFPIFKGVPNKEGDK